MIIDTHSHLNFNAFRHDADSIIQRSLKNDLWMINVGSQYSTSKRAVELAQKHSEGLPAGRQGVYAAVGLHPIHLETGTVKIKEDVEEIQFEAKEEVFDYEKYKALAKSDKVVAIGEVGLDYWNRPKTRRKLEEFKEKQKKTLILQIRLAKELKLPLIFHCRMAHNDLLSILREVESLPGSGIVHCFTGDLKQANEYFKMGLYLGFNGIIFKLDLDSVIEKVPLERMVIETDCPYLTPPPMTGRNEPLYVKYVAQRIAKIKKMSYEDIVKITAENARRVFKI